MKFASLAAVAALGVVVSGCASIVEGTTQSIAITTSPQPGAKCTLKNSEGTWYVTTPGNAQVHKTKHDLDVVCTLAGFKDGHSTVAPHFNGATVGNVIAGGIIGIGIDAATGANFNYPPAVNVAMDPENAAPATPPANAPAPTTVTAPTAVSAPPAPAKPGA
jgi:hypothetical protein